VPRAAAGRLGAESLTEPEMEADAKAEGDVEAEEEGALCTGSGEDVGEASGRGRAAPPAHPETRASTAAEAASEVPVRLTDTDAPPKEQPIEPRDIPGTALAT